MDINWKNYNFARNCRKTRFPEADFYVGICQVRTIAAAGRERRIRRYPRDGWTDSTGFSKGSVMTNSSLRTRFQLDSSNTNQVIISALINTTKEHNLIKIMDTSSSRRDRKYIPYWAWIHLMWFNEFKTKHPWMPKNKGLFKYDGT